MAQDRIVTVMRDAIFTTIMTSAPLLIVAISVGLIVSIFQATTQINEQTLSFTPKIVAVMLSILFFGNYMLTTLQSFFIRVYASIGPLLR